MRTGIEWDQWFLNICNVVSEKSQCLSRKIGSVLVKDKSIISTGYNGPPRGVRTCDERWFLDKNLRSKGGFDIQTIDAIYEDRLKGICPRYIPEMGFKSGEGLEWCIAAHSEVNAIVNAARNGIKVKGTKLYMNCPIPCHNCLVVIINAGIEEIIVTGTDHYDQSTEYLLNQVQYRVFDCITENSKY